MDRPLAKFACGFGFQNWLNFDEPAWQKLVEEAMDQELTELPFKLYGYDIDRKVITNAKENAKRAGVDHVIEFKRDVYRQALHQLVRYLDHRPRTARHRDPDPASSKAATTVSQRLR